MRSGITAFAVLALGAASQAQVSMPTNSMPNLLPQLGGYDPVSIALKNKRQEPGVPMDFSVPDAPATRMDFTYRYDRARTQQNLRNFVARTENPEARANLQQMIAAQPNMIQEVGQAIQPYGLDAHNVADAYALWWINSWLVANQRDEDPDRETIATVKQQVRNAFSATPDFAKTSDAERQEYAEALLLQATLLGSAFDQWKSDPAMLGELSQAAHQGAKASGVDLSLMTLTRNGFVARQE